MSTKFYPTPWRFEESGYMDGPCIKDANGNLVATLLWPGHTPEDTQAAESETIALGRRIADIGKADPPGMDMRMESEESEAGLAWVTITALTQQGEIDLAMEYPRFIKLLERNWMEDFSQ